VRQRGELEDSREDECGMTGYRSLFIIVDKSGVNDYEKRYDRCLKVEANRGRGSVRWIRRSRRICGEEVISELAV